MAKVEYSLPYDLPAQKGNSKARLRPRHQDEIKAKIKAVHILNLIQDHVLTGTEIAQSRIHAGLKLLDKVMANAIAPSIEANQQAQAIAAINQAQLTLMAQEMLVSQGMQSKAIEHSIDSRQDVIEIDSYQTVESQADSSVSLTVSNTVSVEPDYLG